MEDKRFANLEARMDAIQQWQSIHEVQDTNAFREIHVQISTKPSSLEIEAIVSKVLVDFFTKKGVLSKNILVTAALVIGSLTVVFGGLKWLLGLIGFSYLSR